MMKTFLHENIKEHEVSPGQLDDPSACVFTGLGEPTPTPSTFLSKASCSITVEPDNVKFEL
jgi:hypothetical protein